MSPLTCIYCREIIPSDESYNGKLICQTCIRLDHEGNRDQVELAKKCLEEMRSDKCNATATNTNQTPLMP